jgi:transcriptional regulator with XRE-family HTH domain
LAKGVEKRTVVARRLKEARLASGLSQKGLGISAGIDPSVASPRINQYERSVHMPDLSTLGQLASVLNLPLAYFFAVDDDLAVTILAFHRSTLTRRRKLRRLAQELTSVLK